MAGADKSQLLVVNGGQHHAQAKPRVTQQAGELEQGRHAAAVIVRSATSRNRVVVRDEDKRVRHLPLPHRDDVDAVKAGRRLMADPSASEVHDFTSRASNGSNSASHPASVKASKIIASARSMDAAECARTRGAGSSPSVARIRAMLTSPYRLPALAMRRSGSVGMAAAGSSTRCS